MAIELRSVNLGARAALSSSAIYGAYLLRLFTLVDELQNVSEACRLMGVHRSTYYRLKRQVDRWGLRP